MDQNSAVIDEKMKNEIKLKLTDTFIHGLKENKLSLKDMKLSCIYILDNIDNIKNMTQLVVFLDDLRLKWPIYNEVFVFYKTNISEQKEKLVMDKLSQYIKHLT